MDEIRAKVVAYFLFGLIVPMPTVVSIIAGILAHTFWQWDGRCAAIVSLGIGLSIFWGGLFAVESDLFISWIKWRLDRTARKNLAPGAWKESPQDAEPSPEEKMLHAYRSLTPAGPLKDAIERIGSK